jgi:hypothetical protein
VEEALDMVDHRPHHHDVAGSVCDPDCVLRRSSLPARGEPPAQTLPVTGLSAKPPLISPPHSQPPALLRPRASTANILLLLKSSAIIRDYICSAEP